MDVEDAMKAIADGDTAALESVYCAFRVPVFAVAMAIIRDRQAAEDVLQETFLRVYANAPHYQPGTNLKAWVVAIARNLAIDQLRKRCREAEAPEESKLSTHDSDTTGRIAAVEALRLLDLVERQIVVFHDVADLTHAEIARQLALPPGTVRWKYQQARKKLKRMLEENRGD